MSFYDTSIKKTLIPLGLCGISMGLGIATKWTGIYAALGLAVLFFWVLFQRSTFIYHYFGCTLFMIMMIGYSMQKLMAKNKDMKKIIFAYCFLTTIVFIAFYPVISGYPVDCTWASFWLKWLNNWVIV